MENAASVKKKKLQRETEDSLQNELFQRIILYIFPPMTSFNIKHVRKSKNFPSVL